MKPMITSALLNVGWVYAALSLLSFLVLPRMHLFWQGLPLRREVHVYAAFCSSVSDTLKLNYVLMSKSGSSTVRTLMHGWRGGQKPNWNYTVFTVVRDPLERVVSFFFYANMHTYANLSPEQALPLFDEVTAKLVHKQDGHAHGQRSVPLPAGHSYDFVGTLATLAADWARLGELQRQRFGIVEWPPLARRSRDRGQRYRAVLNATSLTVNLSQRICNIYRDDYCCFQLPVPPACRVDCAGGLPADPPQQIRGPG